MKIFLNTILICLFIGCTQKINAQQGQDEYFENLRALQNYSGMTFNVRYAECGEWGGHEEKLEIIDSIKKLLIKYTVYRYDCDSLDYYYYNNNPPIFLSKSKFLDRKDLAEISLYTQQLSQAKLNQSLPFHAGEFYSVCNKDSSFLIRFIGFNDSLTISYKKLIKILFE